MLHEGEEFVHSRNLRRLIEQFSSGNGDAMLRKLLLAPDTIGFTNSLYLSREESETWPPYMTFKKGDSGRDMDVLG